MYDVAVAQLAIVCLTLCSTLSVGTYLRTFLASACLLQFHVEIDIQILMFMVYINHNNELVTICFAILPLIINILK